MGGFGDQHPGHGHHRGADRRVSRNFTVTAFLGLTVNCAVYISFFVLRRADPHRDRPFQALFYPWAPLIILALSLGLLITFLLTDPKPGLWGIAAIALSWPVYRLMRGKQPDHTRKD